ncbi:hypothetical protein ACSSS7_000634 [Eimeria intestinalis]
MGEGDTGGGFDASPFNPADPDSTLSSPFTVVEEDPLGILRPSALGPPSPLPRSAAASHTFLMLLWTVGTAVAFLFALCFRGRRSTGPHGGPRARALAGQDQSGAPPKEDEEDNAFLSYALEACLEMEEEMRFEGPAFPPVPPSEEEKITSIVSSLKSEALHFETQVGPTESLETLSTPGPKYWPLLVDLTAQEGDLRSGGQGIGAGHEGGALWGDPSVQGPTRPTPPTAPELLSLLLQQQQQQQPSSSQAAAAADASKASGPPPLEKPEEADQPPPKRPRKDTGKALGSSLLYSLLQKKSHLPQQQQQQQQQHSRSGAAPAGTPPKETAGMGHSSHDGSLPSSSGGASISSSGHSILRELLLQPARASTSSASPRSSGDSNEEIVLMPSTLKVGQGYICIITETGKKISFLHPPPTPPPNTPPHYQLPVVLPQALQNLKARFHVPALLSGFNGNIGHHLDLIRAQLRKKFLSDTDIEQILRACEQVAKYLLTKQTANMVHVNGARAVERLSMRFICLDALVSCIQVLGPLMRPELWFPYLITKIPNNYEPAWLRETPVAAFNNHLALMLCAALAELKAGRRVSLGLKEKIMRDLFTSRFSPPCFRPRDWDGWRMDYEKEEQHPDSSDTE